MIIFSLLQKIRYYYRKKGFFWVCRHVLTNTIHYQKLLIFESKIDENHHKAEANIPINIRFISESEEDINELTQFWPPNDYAPPFSTPEMINNLIKERLNIGDKCLIAEYDGKIIHMNWLGFHNAHLFEKAL